MLYAFSNRDALSFTIGANGMGLCVRAVIENLNLNRSTND